MGLFSSIKKSKDIKNNSDWRYGVNHAQLEFTPNYLKITTAAVEEVVFYKDIVNVEVVGKIVNIRTMVKTFSLISKQGKSHAQDLRVLLLDKVAENK